jgi:uncharacterized membrane protein
MTDTEISSINRRLAAIEQRLDRIESRQLGHPDISQSPPDTEVNASSYSAPARSKKPVPLRKRPLLNSNESATGNLNVTNILGWAGATALVLAAAYLIRLSIESGWLTPEKQVGLAVLGAYALIAIGLKLRNTQRQYASLLPAGGIIILFLAVYGAHLYFGIIDQQESGIFVILICIQSLLLCKAFDNQLYVLFSVTGSYSAPFLLDYRYSDISGLMTYFIAWSILYSVFSIYIKNRLAYLLALYLALMGFDALWRPANTSDWSIAAAFQGIQFLIFLAAIAIYSIRNHSPLSKSQAYLHAPAIFIFYVLQYNVLGRHLPDYAGWIALASLLLTIAVYSITSLVLRKSTQGGHWLTSFYTALVLVHAIYLDLMPAEYRPWFALILAFAVAVFFFADKVSISPGTPLLLGIGGIYLVNYVHIVWNDHMGQVPYGNLIGFLYAIQLYLGYYLLRNSQRLRLKKVLIYAGHIIVMAATLYFFDERFTVSIAWGLLSIICLILALKIKDQTLGQSSLIVFAASAVKVMLYDLSDASPLIRIACLLVLGITFYLGGWLYRKLSDIEHSTVEAA